MGLFSGGKVSDIILQHKGPQNAENKPKKIRIVANMAKVFAIIFTNDVIFHKMQTTIKTLVRLNLSATLPANKAAKPYVKE